MFIAPHEAGMALLAALAPREAMAVLQDTIGAGDTSLSTQLNLALALDTAGASASARDRMRDVAILAADWDEPHLRLAESLRRDGDIAASLVAYRRCLDRNPDRVEALIGSAALFLEHGDAAGAKTLLRRAVELAPGHPDAWCALGLAHRREDDIVAAATVFSTARQLAPHRFDIVVYAAEAAVANGSAETELAQSDQAVAACPDEPALHLMRGLLLEHLGRRGAAVDALEVAAALAPSSLIPIRLLGGMLARTKRLVEAERTLLQALRFAPDDISITAELGAVYMHMHRPAQACAVLHDLLRRTEPQMAILSNLANATVGCGHQGQATALARAAIALAPDVVLTRRALLATLPYCDGIDGATMLRAARDCAQRLPSGPAPAPQVRQGRLRIGLLGGSFRIHPVGWLTVAGFEALDHQSFELIAFSQSNADDFLARRFRAIAARWVDIENHDDATVAALIREAGIDILIDLGGYGEGGRMTVCALRPAPVQIKWVGIQTHSTGLPAIDGMISDGWETPRSLCGDYSECMLLLPDGYACYSPPTDAPSVNTLPALANGFVTFGCFNNVAKLTPRVLSTWATILRRLPTARLFLKAPQFADQPTSSRITGIFRDLGIDPARVAVAGPSRHRAFLAAYHRVDIVLEPFPYTGGLTTCEALWMGVPSMTLPGRIFSSRHAVSHLSNVGLQGWSARSTSDYVEQTVFHAGDLATLAELRHGLRARVKASPLCDDRRFGENLSALLQSVWLRDGGGTRRDAVLFFPTASHF